MSAWELVGVIGDAIDVDDHASRWRSYMLARCDDVRGLLPPEGERWLQVAAEYAEDRRNGVALLASRVEAWQSIRGVDLNFQDPNVAAVRAVLCLLYPDDGPDADWWMVMEAFTGFVDVAAPDRERDVALLRHLFGDLVPEILTH